MKKARLAYQLYRNRSFISKIPDLFRMIRASFRGEYRMNISSIVISVLIFIYVLSPLDFIPDFLPLIGIADDIGLLTIAISKLMKETENFLMWEAQEGK